MDEFLKWGQYHGVARGTLIDNNYGLSYPTKGTMPFSNRCVLARIKVDQRNKLIAMGVDQIFISPPLVRKTSTVHLMLIYCTDAYNTNIDPWSDKYLEQLYEEYSKMYRVFLLQNFISVLSSNVKI